MLNEYILFIDFRFVNTLALLDQDKVWKSLKKDRAEFLRNNVEKDCYGFISKAEIESNQRKIEQNFQLFNISDVRNISLSKKQIEVGGEMFIMLNTCPDFYKKIYHKAFYGPQSRLGPLSLNIFKKAEPNFKANAKQIFAKVTSVLGFKYIQQTKNAKGNVEFTKSIPSVEGIHIHYLCG